MKNLLNKVIKSTTTPAQVLDLSPEQLIKSIAAEQVVGRKDVPDGFFMAYRHHPTGYLRVENNFFNTALTIFQLQRLKPFLNTHEVAIFDEVCAKAIANYPLYLSRTGKPRYNFWQTRPDKHFPNGYVLGKFLRFRPADDADDTVLAYLTAPHSPQQHQWLRDELSAYANGAKKWSRSMPHALAQLPVYATFFVDKMDVSTDLCVLSNILYWVFSQRFTNNIHDEASLEYIYRCIQAKLHLTKPVMVSRYYPYPVVIMYHVARLIAHFKPEKLLPLIPQLVDELQQLLRQPSKPFLTHILACNALYMLRHVPPPMFDHQSVKSDFSLHFSYFAYPITVEYKGAIAQKLARSEFTHMQFYCRAFFLSLVLEYTLYSKRYEKFQYFLS